MTTTGEEPVAGAERPRSRTTVLRDVAAALAGYLVIGVVAGVLWWLLFDPAMFTKVRGRGSMGELELGKRFNADGWYLVVAAFSGLVSGVAVTAWRSRDLLLTTGLVVAGSCLAAAVMALAGYVLGPGDPDVALAAAQVGAQVPVQLKVTAHTAYLVWPVATLVGALIVLWSPPDRKLR